MENITILTVSWNQKEALELLLKSFIFYHPSTKPYKLVVVDNASTDGTQEWMKYNDIPFIANDHNIGHEASINRVYNDIHTDYVLLNDTDIEYTGSALWENFPFLDAITISAGELIDSQYYEQTKIHDRIAPWFWLWNLKAMKDKGVSFFRSKEDWLYDVGSEYWEMMQALGFKNHNIIRLPGNQDQDLISMRYNRYNHIGKLSWDVICHEDRIDEILRRREYVHEAVKEFRNVDLRGKFISGLS